MSLLPVLTMMPHVNVPFEEIVESKQWIDFIGQYAKPSCLLILLSFCITDVYMFGDKLGFIVGEGIVSYEGEQLQIPTYIFIRGQIGSVFVLVETPEKKYFLLFVKHLRFSFGDFVFETIDCTMDEEGGLHGFCVDNLEDTFGVKLPPSSQMTSLGKILPCADSMHGTIQLFFHRIEMAEAAIHEHTAKAKHERISQQLVFIPYQEYVDNSEQYALDAKIEISFHRALNMMNI